MRKEFRVTRVHFSHPKKAITSTNASNPSKQVGEPLLGRRPLEKGEEAVSLFWKQQALSNKDDP